MHFKSKKRMYQFIGLVIALLVIIVLVLSFIIKGVSKLAGKEKGPSAMMTYMETITDEDIVYNEKIADYQSIVTHKDGKYDAIIFNSEGEEVTIDNLIKKDKWDSFRAKENELLDKKYPKFIADVLKDTPNKVYSFWNEEVIVYYQDVEIEPKVNEELYLKINYNEIKDYLDMTAKLSSDYENEDGSLINYDKKHVAITFDDGPSKYTEELVDILDNNKMHATFFFVGRSIPSKSSAVVKVNNSDHEIGYHSYKHENLTRQSVETIKKEYETSTNSLESIIGKKFTLVRPPYGSSNSTVKNAIDLPFILWNIDTNDWRYRDTDYLVNYCLENVQDGAIILFHDSYETSIKAIEKILPIFYTEGYQVVTVSTLAQIKGVTLENNHSYSSFK